MSNIKVGYKDKKVFNDLNRLITGISNNKVQKIRIRFGSGKIIIIVTKYAADLMDMVSKKRMKYDKSRTIFNDEIIKSVNIIASEKPSDNRAKLLKAFLDLKEVFTGIVYRFKIFDHKYEVVRLKNKADDKQSKLETQNEPLELDKENESTFEERTE